MQRVGYGLTDFFISWLRIDKNISRLNGYGTILNLTHRLKEELDARKAELFDTPSMVAAMYLDPRVKYKLTRQQKECAILHLKKVYIKLQQLKTVEVVSNSIQNNTLDELNDEYAAMNNDYNPDSEIDTSHLMLSFANYDAVMHMDYKCNVMEFWTKNKEEFQLLYPLACVMHTIPAGQCFEERNFSFFSYIRNARRTSLKSKNLQNIITIRLNRDIFYQLKQEEVDSIINS